MKKIVVPIKGMHCRSCELLIEDNLKEVPGVEKIDISYKKSQAELYCKFNPDEEKIKEAVEGAGYEIGNEEKKNWFTKNYAVYINVSIALLVLSALFVVGKVFGVFNNFSAFGQSDPSSLVIILLVGLTAGFSTCMALVGGLVLSISARHAEKHPEANAMHKFRPHLFFNLGRLISYAFFGGMIGLLGNFFQLAGPPLGILIMFVGLVMLVIGIQLTELSPRIAAWSFTLPSSIAKFFGINKHHEKEYSHANSMLAGALTFFLPCGFTQAMQLYAMTTGSFIAGAVIMGTFALGTLPGLLGIGGLTSVVRGSFAKRFFAFAGVLVIFFAVFNISNGYNLTGWSFPSFLPNNNSQETNVVVENNVQIANMVQSSYGYSPNNFVIRKGVPVKWVIYSQDAYSCASSIQLPKLGIRKNLQYGENVIEFTPEDLGELKFMCSMGMYRGKFVVVDNDDTAVNDNSQDSINSQDSVLNSNSTGSYEEYGVVENPTVEDFDSNSVVSGDDQVLKTTFLSSSQDIYPNEFTVSAGKSVKFVVDVKENGYGCMSTITIPGLYDDVELLKKGDQITFNFTPQEKGDYAITCAMGVPRGVIHVN